MADEALCSWRSLGNHDCRDVSVMANPTKAGGMVSEYGHARAHRIVLRDVDFPPDLVLHNGAFNAERSLVISESLRGRGLFRQFQASLGMARGKPSPRPEPCSNFTRE